MRFFVAVTPGAELREELARWCAAARARCSGDGRWTRPEKLHLTLRFMGEVAPERVPQISDAIARAVAASAAFEIAIGAPGSFRLRDGASVLWLGIRDEAGALGALRARLDTELANLGYARDSQEFKPHLTVARFAPGERSPAIAELPASPAAGWPARELELYESVTRPEGAEYRLVQKFAFADSSL